MCIWLLTFLRVFKGTLVSTADLIFLLISVLNILRRESDKKALT